MGIYIEALILYLVLFYSGNAGFFAGGGQEGFSVLAELKRLFMHNIPSLALIWYMLLMTKKLSTWGVKPGKNDLISAVFTLPALLITGFIIANISSQVSGSSAGAALQSPSTIPGWILLCFSCFTAAYLEESFFRFYLLSRRNELKLSATSALILSVALFSICHIYEGPWGFLNSVLSGTVLCFMFLRYKSLHGIAIAHGIYNIAVYVINAILS